MDIHRFWGKAQPGDVDDGPQWHPLVFHCLDVAAVGAHLLVHDRGPGEGVLRLLGLPRDQAADLICYLLCLHDIGKFAKKFQAKAPRFFPSCFDDDPAALAARYDHGAGGLRLFDADGDLFMFPRGVSPSAWRPLISAVTGHHGSPPEPRVNESPVALRPDYGTAGIQAAGTFIQRARGLFALPQQVALDRARTRRASFALAGIAILADWIGSSQEWFPYREPDQDLGAYWKEAREQAESAVEEAGVLPAGVNARLDYDALIGGHAPSPMQAWAQRVELPAGPGLFMIEDETGSGKTEAALMLAHRLMASGRADGIYVALPTMATANAMFDRLALAHRRLFAADDLPSVALVHGAREMHAGFRSAMRSGGRNEAPYSGTGGPDEAAETTASAACAAWIADDRRRAFLADAGAGTVDQALLSVLPSRHQALRLLGLMRRVLVLDEVHAYDAYMQREIESLLEFQAGLGGSSILLSATLPVAVRNRLANAFAKGLGRQPEAVDSDGEGMEYPMATVCSADQRAFMKVAGRSGRARKLPVRFLRVPEEALTIVERAARAGKAVLYIRNTVDDALDAYQELTDRGLAPDLFHARFALTDRLQTENRVVASFGKGSCAAQRAGTVLIATQVVEQSLDLDFDVMITDLAPIDLLIQRAGRLWRHDRPEREGQPELLVVGPEPRLDASAQWFRNAFPRAAYVYRDHARLWLTARVLEETGVIESPSGLRTLVEAVYRDDAEACLPEALRSSLFDAEGRAGAERGVATTNVLDLAKGYVRDSGPWDTDARTPTRLADDPRVTLRLARVRGGRIEPYAQAVAPEESWRAWRLSEVSVSARRVGAESVPERHSPAAAVAKADWTRFDREKILVACESEQPGEVLVGVALSGGTDSREIRLSYNTRVGLRWLQSER